MSSWMAHGPLLPCKLQAWLHIRVTIARISCENFPQCDSLTYDCSADRGVAFIGLSMAVLNEANTLFTQLKACGAISVTCRVYLFYTEQEGSC